MTDAAPWLDPAFTIVEVGVTATGAEISADGMAFASSIAPRSRIGLTAVSARLILTALYACEAAGADLFIVRDPNEEPECHYFLDGQSLISQSPGAPSGTGLVWLQTSGSTGRPKWVAHRPAALRDGIGTGSGGSARWFLSYTPSGFAGLQVVLSAALGGHTLIVPPYPTSGSEMALLAVEHRATHLSGTPTFWRSFLLALGDDVLPLSVVTLGGEVADQSLLDALRNRFPAAKLRHLYATTEAGIVFSVTDGKVGFPQAWLETGIGDVRLAITERGTLAVSSPRATPQAEAGFFDTGDSVAVLGDRVIFQGRIDTMVNVGGVKVWPEEVEAHLLRLPFIQEALVTARPNPMTGSILVADLVLSASATAATCGQRIKSHLEALPRAARPAAIRYRPMIETSATGKKGRTVS